jgi:hypothetical protein
VQRVLLSVSVSLLSSMVAGCTGWSDVPGAPVRAVAAEAHLDSWQAEIEDAIEYWRDALEPYGCDGPFHLAPDDPDAHDVRLIPRDEWPEDPNWAGFSYPDSPWERGYIGVKYNAYDVRMLVLAHELGHALGLDHSDDPGSVMNEHNFSPLPSADDAAAAAKLLGCAMTSARLLR